LEQGARIRRPLFIQRQPKLTPMRIKTERNIAVFDVDGVIVQNPHESLYQTITDGAYWDLHWNDPDNAILNKEIADLARALYLTGWHLVFLTARPSTYRKQTVQLLKRAGFFDMKIEEPEDLKADGFMLQHPVLLMFPETDIPTSSAAWKQSIIRDMLAQGGKVRFMMEDYRPNAEAVRAVVPVLLYERKRPSKLLAGCCPGCGGVAACWCNPSETPSA
jgi:hypothetical protein